MDTKYLMRKEALKYLHLVGRIDDRILRLFIDTLPVMNKEQINTTLDALEIYAEMADALQLWRDNV